MKYTPSGQPEFSSYLMEIFPEEFPTIESCKQITFYTGSHCTLRCTYCYENHDNLNEELLSFEAVKPFIDNLFSGKYPEITVDNTKGIVFEFIGGEPFIAIDAIIKITDYIFNYMVDNNHPWLEYFRISICTNGTMNSDYRVKEYLRKYHHFISLAISIDGHKELHDRCRIFPDGSGSFDIAINAKREYEKNLLGIVSNKLTFSHDNLPELSKAIIFMINEGYTEINGNVVFEDVWKPGDNLILYKELCKLSDYLIDTGKYKSVYVSFFDETLGQPMDPEDNQNWCGGTGGSMMAINAKGEIYTCIRYMECSLQGKRKPLTIGNITGGFYCTDEQRAFRDYSGKITRKSQSTDECFNCSVASGCAWCFPYDTKINIPNGFKNIGDIVAGDFVIDMHGNQQIVNSIYSREVSKDDLVYVNATGITETLTTKEHPFWCMPVEKRIGNVAVYGEPRWVKAGNLKVSDRIGIKLHKFGDKHIDKYIAYFTGRYLGDGYKLPVKRKTPFRYGICCGLQDEAELEAKFIEAGWHYNKHYDRTAVEFDIAITGNEEYIGIIESCGRYAHGKHLPIDAYSWDKESVGWLIKGYLDADGYLHDNIYKFCSVSYDLVFGMSQLIMAVYHKPISIVTRHFKNNKCIIEGREVNARDSYECSFNTVDHKRNNYIYDEVNNIIWCNVKKPKKNPPDNIIVYNMSVADTETYIANNIMVHNCSAANYQYTGTINKRITYICPMHKARVYANVYHWNRVYKDLGVDDVFENHLSREDIDNIEKGII